MGGPGPAGHDFSLHQHQFPMRPTRFVVRRVAKGLDAGRGRKVNQVEGEEAFQEILLQVRSAITGWVETRKLGEAANLHDPKYTDPMVSSDHVLLVLSALAAEIAYWTEAMTTVYSAEKLQSVLQAGADAGRKAAVAQQPVRRADPKKDGN